MGDQGSTSDVLWDAGHSWMCLRLTPWWRVGERFYWWRLGRASVREAARSSLRQVEERTPEDALPVGMRFTSEAGVRRIEAERDELAHALYTVALHLDQGATTLAMDRIRGTTEKCPSLLAAYPQMLDTLTVDAREDGR